MPTRLALDNNIAGIPLRLLYIADKLGNARKAEELLKGARIDFVMELDRFMTTNILLLGAEYWGLFFYVPAPRYGFCRDLLHANGLKDTVDEEL
jgi:hypothetical protein